MTSPGPADPPASGLGLDGDAGAPRTVATGLSSGLPDGAVEHAARTVIAPRNAI